MPKMNLDLKDRLILANQYRILAALYPDDAEYYKRNEEIVENGYEIAYDWLSESISSGGMSEAACREVMNILDMFRKLGYAYEELPDKSGIDAREVRFSGFDGNNESAQLLFHEFLEKQGKWKESPARNSHSHLIGMYRRMLAAFQPLKDKPALAKTDIEQVLAVRIHPENR